MAPRKYTDESLTICTQKSRSFSDVFECLGYKQRGYSAGLKKSIKRLELDISHFTKKGTWHQKGRYGSSSETAKRAFTKERGWKCEMCNRKTWMGNPIPLELHHVNPFDRSYTEENIQVLCRNCHAQTDSFCGKMRTNYRKDD